MPVPCDASQKVVAQTLFLGASVSNFSINMGWGGQPSQLTVNLIEDQACSAHDPQFVNTYAPNNPNHYHDCTGNACYMGEDGQMYDPNRHKERLVPGKVYYYWDAASNKMVSSYWYHADPGFFGTGTKFDIGFNYTGVNGTSYEYDIINTPVFFKIGDFEFTGLIKNWERDEGSGGFKYTVVLESLDSILSDCHIILNKYAGTLFSMADGATVGGAFNQIGQYQGVTNHGTISQGAIPNVFNVYGFLESYGFGTSDRNDEGITANNIKNALAVLTSNDGTPPFLTAGKAAYSNFGRILFKVAQQADNYLRVENGQMGLVEFTRDSFNIQRNYGILDLSELPDTPDTFRFNEATVTVTEFVRKVTSEAGYDYYFESLPTTGALYIKLRVISRKIQPYPDMVKNTIAQFKENGFNLAAGKIGQEKNENVTKVMQIGGPQKRLYQATSYTLGFTQNSYVFSPSLLKFVNYNNYNLGKVRFPNAESQRRYYEGELSDYYTAQKALEERNNITFNDIDNNWASPNISYSILRGNYRNTVSAPLCNPVCPITASPNIVTADGDAEWIQFMGKPIDGYSIKRYRPMQFDAISPFFGYYGEDDLAATGGDDNPIFQTPRTVYLDTWTGQLAVACSFDDMPNTLEVGLSSIRGGGFLVTESEIRAAESGWQSYLTYCMGKTEKPDLYTMLIAAYAGSTTVADLHSKVPADRSLASMQNSAGALGSVSFFKQDTQQNAIDNSWLMNPDMLRDFIKISDFVRSLAKYYGTQYLVRLPNVVSYRDRSAPDASITFSGDSTNSINAYQGSGKIFYEFEPTDGAWEEYGNSIDGNITVGSPQWYALINEDGKMPAILGYNLKSNFDYISHTLCKWEEDLKGNAFNNYAVLLRGLNAAYFSGDKSDPQPSGSLKEYSSVADCSKDNFYISPLNLTSLDASDFVISQQAGGIIVKDAFDRTEDIQGGGTGAEEVPAVRFNRSRGTSKKLYKKATSETKPVFLDPQSLSLPCVLVKTNRVNLNNSSYSYGTDPNTTVLANVAAEDLAVRLRILGGSAVNPALPPPTDVQRFINDPIVRVLTQYVSPTWGSNFTPEHLLYREPDDANPSSKFDILSPKAAHPIFAGVPIQYNRHTYGPWANYPYEDRNIIFPDAEEADRQNAVENLIAGSEIEVDEELSPWNYGGMTNLDTAAFNTINSKIQYQQVLELGSVQMPGTPIFGIGSAFAYNDARNNYTQSDYTLNYGNHTYNIKSVAASTMSAAGPTITSISCNLSPQSAGTTYSFKTYVQKLGTFNKQATDRLKKTAQSIMAIGRSAGIQSNSAVGKALQEFQNFKTSLLEGPQSFDSDKFKSKFFATSPGLVLVGAKSYYLPDINQRGAGDSEISQAEETIRTRTFVGLYPENEVAANAAENYQHLSMASLDSIFSPVSFYPALQTFGISKTPRHQCHQCQQTGKIKNYVNDINTNPSGTTVVEIEINCPYCTDKLAVPSNTSKTSLAASSSSPEALPPYIISDSNDISNLTSMLSANSSSSSSSSDSSVSDGKEIPINQITLNPVTVSSGIYRNTNSQVVGERGRNAIEIIGRGVIPPNSFRTNTTTIIDSQDYSNTDERAQNSIASNGTILNNQRFFALKGPMMFHGWGYDVNGYPVPNESDEPQVDEYNRPLRFNLIIENIGSLVSYERVQIGSPFVFEGEDFEQGKYNIKAANDAYSDTAYADRQCQVLQVKNDLETLVNTGDGAFNKGDILTKQYEWNGNKYVKQERSTKFALNWSEKPDLWPVGPIDLRWDADRKVWTVPTSSNKPYKLVYVTLEQDLIKPDNSDITYSARGFLDDIEYMTESLPENYRRLVYVRDRTGFTAPRGAKLLCRYMSSFGFYEPISKPSIVAKGLMSSNNSANIEMTYTQGRQAGVVPTINVSFDNPLGLSAGNGKTGIFTFIDGKWTLTSS